MATKRAPPPLPPRQNSGFPTTPFEDAPPPYDSGAAIDMSTNEFGTAQDPRSSSTQSLVPSESNPQNERRKLLLIYIHGFMGNETSFRSFPAHVHNLMTALMVDSHVVHTKVYPRYRSKRNISFARDDFSEWLEPHEDPKTDVVLLGHSMGGLLAAEVVLKPASAPASRPFKHRILGAINFDVPFLGMHPGVVSSGLASIFKPADGPPGDKYSPQLTPVTSNDGASSSSGSMAPRRTDTLWEPDVHDPNFNQSFTNDVVLPVRKGWRSAWHFINKHSGELTKATKQLVSSHMEFGGAMANYGELKARYGRVRALEEEDAAVRRSIVPEGGTPSRVRFINYYTASTGRPKRPKAPKPAPSSSTSTRETSSLATPSALNLNNEASASGMLHVKPSRTPSPRISLDEYRDDGSLISDLPVQEDEASGEDWEEAAETLRIEDPRPIGSDDENTAGIDSPAAVASPSSPISRSSTLPPMDSLPAIPELPPAPPPLNVSFISDPDTRKLVEKEHARAVKAYEKAVRDRDKAIADRVKLQEKRDRNSKKDAEKASRNAEKAKKAAEKANKDALRAEQKAEADRIKQAEKQRNEAGRELTQSQGEALRLENEKQRMEAEARRMRGEKEPPAEQKPDVAENATSEDFDDPPEQDLSSMTSHTAARSDDASDPPEQDLASLRSHQTARSEDAPDPPEQDLSSVKPGGKDKGPPKDRMFCSLPPKDSNGQRDPCWVRVFMENVDEVGAHCGLFFVDERYERLVGDVGERIEGWIRERDARRMAET